MPRMKLWSFRGRSGALLVLGLLLVAGLSDTSGQTPPDEKKIEKLEKQLEELQRTVQELRHAPQPAEAVTPAATNNAAAAPAGTAETNDVMALIRAEGLNHSQVMQTLSYLSDVIGPRLTGSPNLKRANEWTRDKLAGWGLVNGHLEAWGPFGRGWALRRFSAQITEPQNIPLMGFPNAWSPGLEHPLEANVVYLDAKTDADLEKFKGNLKGAVVLASPVRELRAHFEPQATRLTETNLLPMANADGPGGGAGRPGSPPAGGRRRTSGVASTNNPTPARWPTRNAVPGLPDERRRGADRQVQYAGRRRHVLCCQFRGSAAGKPGHQCARRTGPGRRPAPGRGGRGAGGCLLYERPFLPAADHPGDRAVQPPGAHDSGR